MNTAILHPQAPAAQPAGKRPLYLIRKDGVVLDYNPHLAQRSGFTPADELPARHLEELQAALARDEKVAAERAHFNQQYAQESQRREAGQQQRLDAVSADSALIPEGQWQADRLVIANAADKAALKPFFERAGIKPDLRQPLEALRDLAADCARPKAR